MHLLITAGPTREPIDAVRFISNRSSGRMGVALARAGAAAGHAVTLLLGPVEDPPALPADVALHRFQSTAELGQLLDAHAPACDALLMAAAVADYTVAEPTADKLPRAGQRTLTLTPTPDLVAAAAAQRRPGQVIVAFALEPAERLPSRAMDKLRRKGVDAIVANPLETMDAGDVTATLLTAAGERHAPGAMSKDAFAKWLIEQVERLHATG